MGAGVWVRVGGGVGEGSGGGVEVAAAGTSVRVGICVSPEAGFVSVATVSAWLGVRLAAEQAALARRARAKTRDITDDRRIALLGGKNFNTYPLLFCKNVGLLRSNLI